jgi:hypothetical protein
MKAAGGRAEWRGVGGRLDAVVWRAACLVGAIGVGAIGWTERDAGAPGAGRTAEAATSVLAAGIGGGECGA